MSAAGGDEERTTRKRKRTTMYGSVAEMGASATSGLDEEFSPDGDLLSKLRPGMEVIYIQEGHQNHKDLFDKDFLVRDP